MKKLALGVCSVLFVFGIWAGERELLDVVMDGNGNLISLRQFQTKDATRNLFNIDKRDADGRLHWQMSMEAYGPAEIKNIHTIDENRTVVVGNFRGSLFTQTWQLASSGQQDSFMAIIDAEGSTTWMCQFGGISDSQIRGSQLINDGSFVVFGTFEGMMFAENLPIYAGDGKGWFYAVFDQKGELLGLENIQGSISEENKPGSPLSAQDLEQLHKTLRPRTGPPPKSYVIENPAEEEIPNPHPPVYGYGG